MMGKNHAYVSTCILCTASCVAGAFLETEKLEQTIRFFYPETSLWTYGDISCILWTGILFLLFLLGVLAPDIACSYSMLGRWIHLPCKHRTWTHGWLAVSICLICAWKWTAMRIFCLGYCLHIWEDALSYNGINFFYPFTKQEKQGIGYRTGSASETCIVLLISAFCIYFIWYYGWHNRGIFNYFKCIRYLYPKVSLINWHKIRQLANWQILENIV